ncbi:MAG: dockerin type I domain-containing protein [Chthoniobacterales bacterium]
MKTFVTYSFLSVVALLCLAAGISQAQGPAKDAATGVLETSIVAQGSVTMDLALDRLKPGAKAETLRLAAVADSFFPITVFNGELRGPGLGSIALTGVDARSLPQQLQDASERLMVEKVEWSSAYDLVVRDAKTGFVFFNVEGHQYSYDVPSRTLRVSGGRLLVSDGFAKNLGRPEVAGATVGSMNISATMRPIEVQNIVNGVAASVVLPTTEDPPQAFVPGPDVIVGDLPSMSQFGSNGGMVGLAVGTTSCNAGSVPLNWFAMPNTDHPVIPQNFYRMSGGANNSERFEQVGQSWLKHAFTALQGNACGLGCTATGGTTLGVGCSDPYGAGLNASQSGLGSRAWVNPFTGAYPTTARDHGGHAETGTSHRVLVSVNDLNTTMNPGATYFAEAQYVTPHEYAWCQSHPGECNMYNNASYRQFTVSGTASFTFSPVGGTVRTIPAIYAWTGATVNMFEPAPGADGRGFVASKVTGPVGGMYHYEYAVNNQNLDRAIQSFRVPLGCGVAVSNVGFHAPPNEPGSVNDGTVGNAGFSNAPWANTETADALTWNSETFSQNPNANALRWGTLYNFRFDSARPPTTSNATVGFFKTGAPITVAIQVPTPEACAPLTFASAVSRKTHGAAGAFDISLPLSGAAGVECRSGGAGNQHTIVLTFSNEVVSGDATVTSGAGTARAPVFNDNTMTIVLSGVADQQQLTLTVANVTDRFAQTMPAAAVPVKILLGDTTGSSGVNSSDLAQTKAAVGTALDGANFRTDVNVSGAVNASDLAQVKAAAGNAL